MTTMKLTANQMAPDFETEDVFGNPVSLRRFSGKPLLLSFFRNGGCAMCNLRLHHLIQHYAEWHRQGLEMLAVFESPRESILTHVTRQNVPFSIIADPLAVLYDLYGLESSQEKVLAPVDEAWRNGMIAEAAAIGYALQREAGSNFFRLPAEFLIGPDQRVQIAFYSDVVGEHLTIEQIAQAINVQQA